LPRPGNDPIPRTLRVVYSALGPTEAGCTSLVTDPASCQQLGHDDEDVIRVVVNFGKAIAAYLRQLSCGTSRFDEWMQGNDDALSDAEIRGAEVFIRSECDNCHSGPFLTDQWFHNVGTPGGLGPFTGVDTTDDPGVAVGLSLALEDPLGSQSEYSDGYDERLKRIPNDLSTLLGAFRTPGCGAWASVRASCTTASTAACTTWCDCSTEAEPRAASSGRLRYLRWNSMTRNSTIWWRSCWHSMGKGLQATCCNNPSCQSNECWPPASLEGVARTAQRNAIQERDHRCWHHRPPMNLTPTQTKLVAKRACKDEHLQRKARHLSPPPWLILVALGGAPVGCASGTITVASTQPEPGQAETRTAPTATPATKPVGAVAPTALRVDTSVPLLQFSDPERNAKLRAHIERLRPEFDRELAQLEAPGWAWAFVIDDSIAATGVGGVLRVGTATEVTTNTVFRIGSISKTFIGLAALQLRDRGLLNLDAPASDWLPELSSVVYPEFGSAPISLRHLLTHTSGMPALGNLTYSQPDLPPMSEQQLLGGLHGVRLSSSPGRVNAYSNYGAAIAGLVVGRAASMPYDRYLAERVLHPLKMTDTGFEMTRYAPERLARPHHVRDGVATFVPEWQLGAAASMGGLYSTVTDMGRYVAALVTAWAPQTARPSRRGEWLRPSSIREATNYQVVDRISARLKVPSHGTVNQRNAADEPPGAAKRIDSKQPASLVRVGGTGLAWGVGQACDFEHLVTHAGATEGHAAMVAFVPQRGVGLVTLTNGADAAALIQLTVNWLRRVAQTGDMRPRRTPIAEGYQTLVRQLVEQESPLSQAQYQHWFAETFRVAVPFSRVAAVLQSSREALGACRWSQPLRVETPFQAEVSFECERGWLSLDATVSSSQAPVIKGLLVHQHAQNPASQFEACVLE